MMINSDTMISISDVNQNFSRVARLVDQYGSAVILKNNSPKYLIMEFNEAEKLQAAPDEMVNSSSDKFLKRNKSVYEELAK